MIALFDKYVKSEALIKRVYKVKLNPIDPTNNGTKVYKRVGRGGGSVLMQTQTQ
jgi:hypothetical protein